MRWPACCKFCCKCECKWIVPRLTDCRPASPPAAAVREGAGTSGWGTSGTAGGGTRAPELLLEKLCDRALQPLGRRDCYGGHQPTKRRARDDEDLHGGEGRLDFRDNVGLSHDDRCSVAHVRRRRARFVSDAVPRAFFAGGALIQRTNVPAAKEVDQNP